MIDRLNGTNIELGCELKISLHWIVTILVNHRQSFSHITCEYREFSSLTDVYPDFYDSSTTFLILLKKKIRELHIIIAATMILQSYNVKFTSHSCHSYINTSSPESHMHHPAESISSVYNHSGIPALNFLIFIF